MRYRSLAPLVVVVVLTVSCSDASPVLEPSVAVDAGTSPNVRPTLAPTTPPTTVVIEAVMPPRVEFPGDPSSYSDGPGESAPNTGRVGQARVTLPDDYLNRHDVGICVHTDDLGWHGCSQAGLGAQILNSTDDVVSIVLVDLAGEERVAPLRRLAVLPVSDAQDIEWRIVDGYETLAELLTLPPPADGNYLEPIT